jgi:hypothetical protein
MLDAVMRLVQNKSIFGIVNNFQGLGLKNLKSTAEIPVQKNQNKTEPKQMK